MYRYLPLTTIFILLAGCTSNTPPPSIPQFTFDEKHKDSDGYYKYSTYWFNGQLKNGIPHGLGQCRTLYVTAQNKSEWLNAACEFVDGVRVDTLHKQRLENSLALTNAERQSELRNERERQARQEQMRREAEAEHLARQQMLASAILHGVSTLSTGLQQAENDQMRFNARIAETINNAQQQRQQQVQQARQAETAISNTASVQQTAQNREQALRESAATERQRLQQEQQHQQEAEQQQALLKRQEEQKRQKELALKKQEEQRKAEEARKKQEIVDYSRAIRAGTQVGAISCHGGQSTRIVGVLGRAQRPKHVYNNCNLQEVRYRCPSQSNWQHYSRSDWMLNNSCQGMGDDVTVNVNCPAEQLIVQPTRFSCDAW